MQKLTREEALKLIEQKISNQNLRKHCYSVGMVMQAMYGFFSSDGRNMEGTTRKEWEIAGLLHDADYEVTKEDHSKHTVELLTWLTAYEVPECITNTIKSHNNKVTGLREPQTLMEKTLECCDELTGFIIAVALVQPSKRLADVTVDSVFRKFKQKEFARAVDREQIAVCESMLVVSLEQFVGVALKAMQGGADALGL